MKTTITSIGAIFLATATFAADYVVTLKANPPQGAALGTPVTLTAELTPKPLPEKLLNEYRFQFVAKSSWPCQKSYEIAGSGAVRTWMPAAGGDYTLTAAVFPPVSKPPLQVLKQPPVTASLPYKVSGPGGGLLNITLNATPTSSPVTSAAVYANVIPPGPAAAFVYRWTLYCETQSGSAHCTGGIGPNSYSGNTVTWPHVAVAGTGRIRFRATVDAGNTITCSEQSTLGYTFMEVN